MSLHFIPNIGVGLQGGQKALFAIWVAGGYSLWPLDGN